VVAAQFAIEVIEVIDNRSAGSDGRQLP